jgi:outer membrane immunogenic protein
MSILRLFNLNLQKESFMKKLLATTLVLTACSFPLVSWAGSDSGLYIGGSVGQSSVEEDFGGVVNFDEEDTGYKLMLGYNFGVLPLLDLAIEADYRDFGTFESGGVAKVDVVTYDIFGVAGFNLGPIGLFGKLGYSDSDIDSVVEDLGAFSDSDSATAYGVGAKFQIGSIALRAEYEVFEMDAVDDLNMLSVGATVTF